MKEILHGEKDEVTIRIFPGEEEQPLWFFDNGTQYVSDADCRNRKT